MPCTKSNFMSHVQLTTPKLKFCNKIEVSEQRTLFLLLYLRFLPLMFWRNPVGTKENGTFDK